MRQISAVNLGEHFSLDRPAEADILHSMKRMGKAGHIFFVFLLAGCLWFMQAALSSPAASAMNGMGSSGVQAKKMNPATCPMKGTLPCCQHPVPVAFCGTSLCDFCLFSGSLQPVRFTQEIRGPSSVPAALPLPIFPVETPPPYQRSPFKDFSRQISFFPPVNRPLLI